MPAQQDNIDADVVRGFGEEWSTFRQDVDNLDAAQRAAIFDSYFHIFPWGRLPPDSVGLDVGCGSGRWSALVAPRVGHLHLMDPSSDALSVARQNLGGAPNVSFHLASVDSIPVPDHSLDFVFSLGVLHHVPNTAEAVRAVAAKLKPGAPFLLYLYYAFDNRPAWYRWLWAASDAMRRIVSRQPPVVRRLFSETAAALLYWPIARSGLLLKRLGLPAEGLPLSYYAEKSYYVMRTDAYDRFCTRLEQRFHEGPNRTDDARRGTRGHPFLRCRTFLVYRRIRRRTRVLSQAPDRLPKKPR